MVGKQFEGNSSWFFGFGGYTLIKTNPFNTACMVDLQVI